MAPRSSALPRSSTPSLDIPLKNASIRTLDGRRPSGAIDRVRGEFAEMRGFSPTLDQAARLFDLPKEECDRVLGSLVRDGSLCRCEDGRYRLL
jgi:hypothetical protein